jgi:hypothetical protein
MAEHGKPGAVVTNILGIRKKVGPDKVLGCRLSGDELIPDDLTRTEAARW